MMLRYRPRRAVSGSSEVGGRAGPKPGRRPPEAVEGSWRIGPADDQPSQAGAGRQQTADNSYSNPVAAKAVVSSNSQPESPEIRNTTNLASSSRSSPTSRPRARRSVPGFPQRVAAPAPSTLGPAVSEHDTTTIAAAAAGVESGIDWPTTPAATEPPQPALLQFPDSTLEPLGDKQEEQEEGEKGDLAKQDILSGDIDTGCHLSEGGEGGVAAGAGVMATTSSLSR